MHFTGGLPPRGPELTSLKYANASGAMRNFLMTHGRVMAITEYSKTDSMLQRSKVIARFFPERVGRLFVTYVADVRPFHEFLSAVFNSNSGVTAEKTPFL